MSCQVEKQGDIFYHHQLCTKGLVTLAQALLLVAVIIHLSPLWPPQNHCDPKSTISFGNSDIFSRHLKDFFFNSKHRIQKCKRYCCWLTLLFAVIIHISSLWPPLHHCDQKSIISFENSNMFSRYFFNSKLPIQKCKRYCWLW